MITKEKRNEIYSLIYDKILNKKLETKEWRIVRESIGKLLKEYEKICSSEKIVYKDRIIYKDKVIKQKSNEDDYWSI